MKHLTKFVILVIKFYHNYLSTLTLYKCRFYPTCSEYTIEAIEAKGLAIGLLFGLKRILSCHPFNAGGFDPWKKG